MEGLTFIKGLALGFSIAAPVGPIGLLCIKRTLARGWLSGVTSGAGAAVADALYGSVAAFGLTAVAALLLEARMFLQVGGGLFLLYLGYSAWRTGLAVQSAAVRAESITSSFVSTFLLTLTNPMTILSFAAVFAGLGIGGAASGYFSPALLVAGVFAGSMLWWLILCSTVNALREKLRLQQLALVNKLSGIILIVFGLMALASRLGG